VPFTIFTSNIVGGIMYNSPTLREYNVIFDNKADNKWQPKFLKKSEFHVFTNFSNNKNPNFKSLNQNCKTCRTSFNLLNAFRS